VGSISKYLSDQAFLKYVARTLRPISAYFGQPPPSHLQLPPEQPSIEHIILLLSHVSLQFPPAQPMRQFEFDAHARMQLPPGQFTVQAPPLGHDVLHPPAVQSTRHLFAPQ